MRATSWLTLVVLTAFVAFVVWSSFGVGGVQCEVCITFAGRDGCRTVEGNTAEEARQAAVTNVCAGLASGVTDSMACERTPPRHAACRGDS